MITHFERSKMEWAVGSRRWRWLVLGKRPAYASVFCTPCWIKGGNDILLCSLVFVHGSWREVSAKKTSLVKHIHRMRKLYKLLYIIDTLCSQNPSWLFLQPTSCPWTFCSVIKSVRVRSLVFLKGLCLLHHNLSSLGATACDFIYLGSCISDGRSCHLSFSFLVGQAHILHKGNSPFWVKEP